MYRISESASYTILDNYRTSCQTQNPSLPRATIILCKLTLIVSLCTGKNVEQVFTNPIVYTMSSPVPRLKLDHVSNSMTKLIQAKNRANRQKSEGKVNDNEYDSDNSDDQRNDRSRSSRSSRSPRSRNRSRNQPRNRSRNRSRNHNSSSSSYNSDSDTDYYSSNDSDNEYYSNSNNNNRRYNSSSNKSSNNSSKSDKVDIIRKAFRHLCRDPATKMRTLEDIRLQFGTPNEDGTMVVTSDAFRLAIPKLLNIVQVNSSLRLSDSDINYLIEEIDLNHDSSITYAEFVNFISFPKSKLRRIARSIQLKLSKTTKTDKEVQEIFLEISTKDHRKISTIKFQKMLETRLDVKLHPGEVETLVKFLDTDGTGDVNYDNFVRFIRDHGLTGRQNGIYEGTLKQRPVVDIVLSFNQKDEKKYKKKGYERLAADLNHGTYGKSIHLWYLREESKTGKRGSLFSSSNLRNKPELQYPIVEIRIDTKDNSAALYADGFKCIDGSTNSGWFNWGTNMYLWIRRDQRFRESVISDLYLTTGCAKDPKSKIYDIPSRGYRRLEANLNHGTSGSDVFFWFHKENHGETPRSKFSKTIPISTLVKLKKNSHGRRWQNSKKELTDVS